MSGGIGQAFGTLAGTTSDIGRSTKSIRCNETNTTTSSIRRTKTKFDAAAQEPFTRLQLGQNC